jgi:hypothetical protein
MKPALACLTLVLSISVGVAACDARRSDSDPDGAARARTGIVFDPSRVRPGDSIAGLVVERVSVSRAMADSTLVGDIAFRGEIELTGRTFIHPDADAADAACFEADSVGAAMLPRWAEDRRRAWFCFSNGVEAIRALGPSREQRRARVVIAEFVIHRGLSDQVNSARFVRLSENSAAAGRDTFLQSRSTS